MDTNNMNIVASTDSMPSLITMAIIVTITKVYYMLRTR